MRKTSLHFRYEFMDKNYQFKRVEMPVKWFFLPILTITVEIFITNVS